MYVRRLSIANIRSIDAFDLRLAKDETPGWHVILGSNGAGKSSVVRSLALALAGPREAVALRQDWGSWVRAGSQNGSIKLEIDCSPADIFTGTGRRTDSIETDLTIRPIETSIGGQRFEVVATTGIKKAERAIWGTNTGWFSSSFGPFRRFTGGDQQYDRLFFTNPRLAPHLSAFGEDVALTEGLRWLKDLRVKELERASPDKDGLLLARLIDFLNGSDLLPHGAKISEVRSEEITILDGDGSRVAVEQLSDGYRSVLSMIFEILRQMEKSYGANQVIDSLDVDQGCVNLPGVVAIDEVDAHLHPSWQRDIGPWFTKCFPMVQFIVTTHSPIVCRSARSVWRLSTPGSDDVSGRIEGDMLNRLIRGSILEAYGTDYFGRDISRSDESKMLVQELANLNRLSLKGNLSSGDERRLTELRRALPTTASEIG